MVGSHEVRFDPWRDASGEWQLEPSLTELAPRISADGIESWDHGFDTDGDQVWGAVKSDYVPRREVTETEASYPPGG